jgi:hypothetical protein
LSSFSSLQGAQSHRIPGKVINAQAKVCKAAKPFISAAFGPAMGSLFLGCEGSAITRSAWKNMRTP